MRSKLFAVLGLIIGLIYTSAAVAQDGYQVRPGDVLSIEVLQDPSLNREVLVTPDGSFGFPFAGAVRAGGRTIDEISATIAQSIASNFATPPNVFVAVRQTQPATTRTGTGPAAPATITIFFLGEVGSPGARAVPRGTTFLQALSESGGLTNFAAERRIQVRRTDPHTLEENVSTIDYRALSRGGRLARDIVLADGDVILVPQRRLFE